MLSRRVRWGVFIMLVKSSGKTKSEKKSIIKVKVPTSFCLTGQQNDAFQNRPRLKLCSVRNLKRICARVRTWSRFVFDQIVFLQMTKLTLSEHWTLRGVVLEVPRGCCCTAEFSSLALEPWSPDGALKNARCWFLEKGHRTVQSEWSWCHLGTTLVFSLFGSWFLGSFWCLCTHVMF